VKLTINHHRAEMSELHIKLIHEQQKTERQAGQIERNENQMRDILKEQQVDARHSCLILR